MTEYENDETAKNTDKATEHVLETRQMMHNEQKHEHDVNEKKSKKMRKC